MQTGTGKETPEKLTYWSFKAWSLILITSLWLSCIEKLQRLKGKLIFFA